MIYPMKRNRYEMLLDVIIENIGDTKAPKFKKKVRAFSQTEQYWMSKIVG